MDCIPFIKERIRGIDTLNLCSSLGFAPEVFGIHTYTIKSESVKTNMFSGTPVESTKYITYDYVASGASTTRELLLSTEDKQSLYRDCAKELVGELICSTKDEFKFAHKDIRKHTFAVSCSRDSVVVLVSEDSVLRYNFLTVCSPESIRGLTVDINTVNTDSISFIKDYLCKRFKVDVTLTLANDINHIEYMSKLRQSIPELIDAGKEIIIRPTDRNYTLMYTNKSVGNCQITEDATESARREHWAKSSAGDLHK